MPRRRPTASLCYAVQIDERPANPAEVLLNVHPATTRTCVGSADVDIDFVLLCRPGWLHRLCKRFKLTLQGLLLTEPFGIGAESCDIGHAICRSHDQPGAFLAIRKLSIRSRAMSKGEDMENFLPSAEEIIRALGLHQRRSADDVLSPLVFLGAGMLIGAGLALLLAPSSGQELRDGLGAQVSELRDRVMHSGQTKSGNASSPDEGR